MAKGSPSKRNKYVLAERKSEEVDRISSLPDELLCHILSFLQTKEVVATSVLSTRWRSVWTLVLALDFEDNWTCFSKTSFTYVVCKVFDQHKAKCVKRLCVSSYNKRCNPEFVSTLLSIALKKNLEELDLFFYFRLEASLPSMLFTCQTISVLKLDGTINLNLPSSVHFPLLKILHLYALYFADDEPITRLLSGCPVLEELCYLEVKIDRICVPSLKKLHFKSKLERLQIDTPLLEHLQIQDTSVTDYSVENLHNLVEAHVDIYFEQDKKEKIPNLFNGIHKIKYLSLSTCATEVLSYACLEFPEFHNLVHLQFSIITLDSYFLVGQLLEKCPKLEVLDVEKVYEDGEIEWTQPTITIPSCLSSHLTVFKFRKYGGSQEELELVEYILTNAEVLKIETIQIASWLKSEEIRCAIAKLSALTRASKDCRTHYLTLD